MNLYPSNTLTAVDNVCWFASCQGASLEAVQTLFNDLYLVCRMDTGYIDPGDQIWADYDPKGCVQDSEPYGLYDYDGLTDEEAEYHGIRDFAEVCNLPPLPFLQHECFTCGKAFEDCDCIFF